MLHFIVAAVICLYWPHSGWFHNLIKQNCIQSFLNYTGTDDLQNKWSRAHRVLTVWPSPCPDPHWHDWSCFLLLTQKALYGNCFSMDVSPPASPPTKVPSEGSLVSVGQIESAFMSLCQGSRMRAMSRLTYERSQLAEAWKPFCD